METRRQDRDILSHQFRGQQRGGTSTHVAPWCERDILRDGITLRIVYLSLIGLIYILRHISII